MILRRTWSQYNSPFERLFKQFPFESHLLTTVLVRIGFFTIQRKRNLIAANALSLSILILLKTQLNYVLATLKPYYNAQMIRNNTIKRHTKLKKSRSVKTYKPIKMEYKKNCFPYFISLRFNMN